MIDHDIDALLGERPPPAPSPPTVSAATHPYVATLHAVVSGLQTRLTEAKRRLEGLSGEYDFVLSRWHQALVQRDEARRELEAERARTWQAWQARAAAEELKAKACRMAYEARNDLHAALCDGAFSIDRDPMALQHVLSAVQNLRVSTGWARTAIRRWLAGLPVPELPDEPDPHSAEAVIQGLLATLPSRCDQCGEVATVSGTDHREDKATRCDRHSADLCLTARDLPHAEAVRAARRCLDGSL